jgi:hypothetical protein
MLKFGVGGEGDDIQAKDRIDRCLQRLRRKTYSLHKQKTTASIPVMDEDMVNSYHFIVVFTDNKVSYLECLPTLGGGMKR